MAETHFMGLRTKILTILAVGMLLLFTLLFLAARTVKLEGFTTLENDKTLLQVKSAVSLLDEQSAQIDGIVGDYAHWDDTYKYIVEPNKEYADANLADSTFTHLNNGGVIK